MAKLGAPMPGPWDEPLEGADFADRVRRESAAVEKLRPWLVSWPRGDGRALYFVESLSPLVLRHVPFGDAWAAEDALIRGLSRWDVEELLRIEREMSAIFGGPKRLGDGA